MRLSVDRINLHGAPERVDPSMLRSAIQRELARAFHPPPPADRQGIASAVADAVRVALKGGDG
jgi:hypothetical protein